MKLISELNLISIYDFHLFFSQEETHCGHHQDVLCIAAQTEPPYIWSCKDVNSDWGVEVEKAEWIHYQREGCVKGNLENPSGVGETVRGRLDSHHLDLGRD